MDEKTRYTLLTLFRSGVEAVKGDFAVGRWLAANRIDQPTHILALGKASVSMFQGLPANWQQRVPSYLVTKTDHLGGAVFGDNVVAREASHPVPDETSLQAGQGAVEFVAAASGDSHLLMLVSGGASALVEHLKDGVGICDLISLTTSALKDGADIAEINRRRREISAIKGGGLLGSFDGANVRVLAISDVQGDRIDVIGSGIGARTGEGGFDYECQIVASNAVARDGIERRARDIGLNVVLNQETLYADVSDVAVEIADVVSAGPDGLYIFGGEPTIVLPDQPGEGGRNQALALELARIVENRGDVCGLVAGTDGTDGPTDAAGAVFDGETFSKMPGADKALSRANSGAFLKSVGDQIVTGPTGTNVMDVAIILKQSAIG